MAERTVPILLSRDLAETLEFYRALGFENRGATPEEWNYLILGRGSAELHFSGDPSVDPFRTASMCYLYVDDADAVFREWEGVVVADPSTGSRMTGIADTDYGMREFAVVDRSGNLVRVGSPMATDA
ncbi:bleomycin resistance protein [Microbacterium immunditiarum]|uniref:Catechol 2,3-dioxygenase-like lactoylglutathione lyase family enzyme n=1 Tax=Microbacterium immunditiarum TaxID=337480 RepID=A0A7Y9KJK4_9MICO|nr:VOC family protein [Microbacterium immunditiarum]NYE19870.1 catechol 2,3-dioxygenase-like lactoylglutathione lyase family enzyme [Microbacterium immunditiarum]